MRVIDDVRQCEERFPGVVLTIGSFDGIHLGHRRILERLLADARARGGTAALMTLRPHPREFFSPRHAPNILTAPSKKEALLREAGIDVLYVLPFDAETAALEREDFLAQVVAGRCRAQKLIVGHDFAFGRGAQGNYEYLCEAAPRLGIEVEQAPALYLHGERVSSTLVRERILQGDLEEAEAFLGRKYGMVGTVVRGRGMGVKLGFPTANVAPANNALPAHGVYVARAFARGRWHAAAVNIGIAPTIRHDSAMIEAHLLDFHGDLAGEEIEIEFHRRLRPEKKYESLEALIEAIALDVAEVRAHFAGRV